MHLLGGEKAYKTGHAELCKGTEASHTCRSFAFWHVLRVHHERTYSAASQVAHGLLRCAPKLLICVTHGVGHRMLASHVSVIH